MRSRQCCRHLSGSLWVAGNGARGCGGESKSHGSIGRHTGGRCRGRCRGLRSWTRSSRPPKQRRRPRDVATFLILRSTGMRRESVATLQVRHLDGGWGLRGRPGKGERPGTSRSRRRSWPSCTNTWRGCSSPEREGSAGHPAVLVDVGSAGGRQDAGADDREEHLAPLQGVRPADRLPDAQAARSTARCRPEVLEQHHDLEEVRALLGHARIDTTQIYTTIRPPQLKRAVAFYEEKAMEMLSE